MLGVGNDVSPRGGSTNVDILASTPGRLVEHVQITRGFTLQHLRILVIDEADSLLSKVFLLPSSLSKFIRSFKAG